MSKLRKIDLMESYRVQAIYYRNKKWFFNKILFNYYSEKYKELANEIIDELEDEFFNNILTRIL